jgi:single-strand DNA-binding protein
LQGKIQNEEEIMNRVILIGRTGADPILRNTKEDGSGVNVASANLATNETWIDRDSKERQEKTEWHRIVAWRGNADVLAKYAKKGRQISVEGRLQTRSWEDKEGVTRYTTEVIAQSIELLGSSNGNRADSQPGDPGPQGPGGEETPVNVPDDDIPF